MSRNGQTLNNSPPLQQINSRPFWKISGRTSDVTHTCSCDVCLTVAHIWQINIQTWVVLLDFFGIGTSPKKKYRLDKATEETFSWDQRFDVRLEVYRFLFHMRWVARDRNAVYVCDFAGQQVSLCVASALVHCSGGCSAVFLVLQRFGQNRKCSLQNFKTALPVSTYVTTDCKHT